MDYLWAIAIGLFSGVFCLGAVIFLCVVVSFARVHVSEWLASKKGKTPA